MYNNIATFFDLAVNESFIDEEYKQMIDHIEQEENEQELDVCRIHITLPSENPPDEIFLKEGDHIVLYTGEQGKVTGYEDVFYGYVKTVRSIFSDKAKLMVEAFEEMMVLDYNEQAVEVDSSADTSIVERFKEYAYEFTEEMKELIGDLKSLLSGESQKSRKTLAHLVVALMDKYPNAIEKHVIDEPGFILEEKMRKGKGKTDYQMLLEIAEQTGMTLSLQNKVLKLVKKRYKPKRPLSYYPPAIKRSIIGDSFVINTARLQTNIRNLTDKVEVVSAGKIGEGEVIEAEEAKDLVEYKTAPFQSTMETLEGRKANMEEGVENGEFDRSVLTHFLETEYNPAKEQIESRTAEISEAVKNNKKFYYEILARIDSGEKIAVKTNHMMLTAEAAKAWAKDYLRTTSRRFVQGDIDLQFGSNIWRTWMKLDAIFLGSGQYGTRFSGEYNISKVRRSIGSGGFSTKLTVDRNFIIGE